MSGTASFLPFARPDIDAATIAAVGEVLASGWITSGPKVLALEERLSSLFGDRPVRVFANGTATMEVALRLAGVGPGDEVITSAITWAATANVVLAVGAHPIFVDIDPATRNLDLDAVEAAITPRARALLPVYLAGLPVDMERLYAIAGRHRLRVIEDAAQAIDARWNGKRIGSFGDLVSFSFQANKNITCAEGGCLVLNSDAEAERAQRLRLQGVVRSGIDGMDVDEPGGKSNLSDVHAAIALGQLDRLAEITRRRAALAEMYFSIAEANGWAELGIQLPPRTATHGAITNWHLFQVVLPDARIAGGRAAVMQSLKEHGIGSGVHYPALHLFSCHRRHGWRDGQLPHAERVGRSILTLPLFPGMRDSDVERVGETVTVICRTLLT